MVEVSTKPTPSPSVAAAVEEIMTIYRSLPPRPALDEVSAAMVVIETSAIATEARIKEVENMEKPLDLAEELFQVLRDAKLSLIAFQGFEQRKEALHVVDLDGRLQVFDEFLQRASELVSNVEKEDLGGERHTEFCIDALSVSRRSIMGEEVERREGKDEVDKCAPLKSQTLMAGSEIEKLGLLQAASFIETAMKKGSEVLDLQGNLKDQIEWLPQSLGKLKDVISLNFSENQIMALPYSIGNLRLLVNLDLHSNQIINLPDSFGELCNLVDLDVHSNRLKSLPFSFGNLKSLVLLDLSCNRLTSLPDSLGNLSNLKKLNIEKNDLEELPHTICSCSCLRELRLDFNQLKSLPEAIGKLEKLLVLTLRYNRVKALPTTMSSLLELEELDVSFNELELVPDDLCLATSLVKLNVGNNFADLRALPRTIGNLEMLEELDISNNQIRILPESFRLLSKLRVLRAYETPMEVPPRRVFELGAQAVVWYMSEFVEVGNTNQFPKRGGFWGFLCSLLVCLGMDNNDKGAGIIKY